MKGLFLKDYYLFIKRCRHMSVLLLFAIIAPATGLNALWYVLYPVLFISMIPMTLIAYDAGDKWTQYAAAMPFADRDIVVEKYLFGLIMSGITIILTVVSEIIVDAVKNQLDGLHYVDLTVMLLSVCLIAPALMLPFVFKYGVEKGRIVYYIVVGVVCSVVVGLSSGVGFSAWVWIGNKLGPAVPAGSILLYILSITLSIRFFKQRKLLA